MKRREKGGREGGKGQRREVRRERRLERNLVHAGLEPSLRYLVLFCGGGGREGRREGERRGEERRQYSSTPLLVSPPRPKPSTLPKKSKDKRLTFSITQTTAPHPEYASLSTAFKRVCEIVSNKSSASRLGSQRDSAMPKSFSEAVPETTKSYLVERKEVGRGGGRVWRREGER